MTNKGTNKGRRGRNWQHHLRPATLAAARGICALCGSTTCPTCGQQACGGRTPPGQVDHIYPPATHPHLAEDPANLRAAHMHCNNARNRASHTPTHTPW